MKKSDLEVGVDRLEIDDGKYTLILTNTNDVFTFECFRYGIQWRDLIGDNLIMAMFHEILELKEKNAKLEKMD